MKKSVVALASMLLLGACVSTSSTQVSRNEFLISTSAAPVCGGTGAQKVAAKMAAVEVLRNGFERYRIVGAQSQNNVGSYTTGPTYANTFGNYNVAGNSVYGSSNTYYGGQQTVIYGSHDTTIGVVGFNRGEPGYNDAVDAKRTLGPDWQKLVESGINTCS